VARYMHSVDQAVYRAVIVETYPAEDPLRPPTSHTSYAGPYASKGAASGAISRVRRLASRRYRNNPDRRPTVTGHVERAASWERVED
jgi:hypothetical protein